MVEQWSFGAVGKVRWQGRVRGAAGLPGAADVGGVYLRGCGPVPCVPSRILPGKFSSLSVPKCVPKRHVMCTGCRIWVKISQLTRFEPAFGDHRTDIAGTVVQRQLKFSSDDI